MRFWKRSKSKQKRSPMEKIRCLFCGHDMTVQSVISTTNQRNSGLCTCLTHCVQCGHEEKWTLNSEYANWYVDSDMCDRADMNAYADMLLHNDADIISDEDSVIWFVPDPAN